MKTWLSDSANLMEVAAGWLRSEMLSGFFFFDILNAAGREGRSHPTTPDQSALRHSPDGK